MKRRWLVGTAAGAALAGALAWMRLLPPDRDVPRRQLGPAPAPLPPRPSAPPGSRFPLRAAPDLPYLLDAQGRPFLLVGDSAWSVLVQLTPEEVEVYLDDRQRRGFNAVLVSLIECYFSQDPPRTREGIAPFAVPRRAVAVGDYLQQVDFDTPDDAYFDRVDHLFASAARRGILVLATPAYLGYAGGEQGWWQAMRRNGADKLRSYGRYLGRRLRQHRNVLWVHGGDFTPPHLDLVEALADGLLEYTREDLHTFHGARGSSAFDIAGPGRPWVNVGNIYTGAVVHAQAREHRTRWGSAPFFLIEAYYEGYASAPKDPRLTRWQAYQALLGGACGQVSGHDDIWQFRPQWRASLDNRTARAMTHLHELFGRLPWWTLRPDDANDLQIEPLGSGHGRCAAALSADATLAVVYIPDARGVTFAQVGKVAGRTRRATWVDPTNGRTSAALSVPDAVAWTPPAPGANSEGAWDWLLTIRAEG